MIKKIKSVCGKFFFTSIFISYFLTCVVEQTTILSKIQKVFIIIYFTLIFIFILKFISKKVIIRNLKYRSIILLLAIIISFIFRNQLIPKIYNSTDIAIRVLDQNDPASLGKEAWLISILVNNKSQSLSSFVNKEQKNSWIFQDNALYGDFTKGTDQLLLHFVKAKFIQLNFGKHSSSGIIEVTTNNSSYIYNLYDDIGDKLEIDIPITYEEYSFFEQIILLLGISFIIFYLLELVSFKIKDIKKEKKYIDLTERYIGIDIIKTIGIFFVISIHFFLNTNFYTTALFGEVMYLQLTARWLFFTCVPLFLLSTGYLQKEKVYNHRYFQVGCNILGSYISISIIIFFYRIIFLKEEITIIQAIKGILNFSLDPYGWYIAMFIGLYMLIPAVNIIYKNIGNKKNKLNFILVLCCLTSIPVSGFLSNEWVSIYPITYYFIGAYIREFTPKINKIKGVIWIILILMIEDLITIFFARYNGTNIFNSILIDRYGFFLNLCVSVILFLILYDIKKCHKFFAKCFRIIAQLTFEIYLISFIFDSYFYSKFKNEYFITQQDFSKYYFVIVPCVFGLSFILASIYSYFKYIFIVKK